MAVKKTKHPVIVVCGEHSSGKSSLINLLFQSEILPLSVVRNESPLQRILNNKELQIIGTPLKGDKVLIPDADTKNISNDYREITYLAPTEYFQGAEIIELQISEVPQLDDEALEIVNSADLFIWCSNATQAWRNTEQAIVKSFKSLDPQRTMMALTRGDHLKTTTDETKVLDRVRSSELFQSVFLDVALIKSSSSSPLWKKSEAEWRKTGVSKIVDTINIIPNIDGKIPAALLKSYKVIKPAAADTKKIAKKPIAKKPTKASPTRKRKVKFSANIDILMSNTGLKSAYVFGLNDKKPLQEFIANDSEQVFQDVSRLAKLFKSLNPDEVEEMNVTLAERENWTLIKYSKMIPGAICAVRISRSSGNLGTIRNAWDNIEFELL